ncbi:hypothetical protein G6F56_000727 [Rhizopus delemar]|nr:hypothetical protein G6F56_000727 [Rhizopus delemar]
MTNNKNSLKYKANKPEETQTMTRMHPSMKRPRAPIACYRCHHKKVRCDGVHPNCTRCLSTGVLCAYPSSRRSRNTQPTSVDPFINNLSQLESKIRKIETDLESQRSLVHTLCGEGGEIDKTGANTLNSRIIKTEKDLQESRSIVAQLRLRGEQRAARGRRAAAAAAAAAAASSVSTGQEKNTGSGKKNTAPSTVKSDEMINYYPNYPDLSYSNDAFQDWLTRSPLTNGFVDPMVIAAAESSMAPLFSMYMEDSGRTRALSHLPTPATSREQSMVIPNLQPSCSSTSTSSTSSFGILNDSNPLYDESYIQFMNNNEMMMIDQITK